MYLKGCVPNARGRNEEVKELRSEEVKELSQMYCCRVKNELTNLSTHKPTNS
jgi:hypothetical protein